MNEKPFTRPGSADEGAGGGMRAARGGAERSPHGWVTGARPQNQAAAHNANCKSADRCEHVTRALVDALCEALPSREIERLRRDSPLHSLFRVQDQRSHHS